ncbi:uncharacterized protein LOC105195266 isoform X2 [Solenopsis invicta]|uniref:uncharacterized protein LOC105195266 isoform X2 n=1 Tax=Solenopsis invicta TaxID=13686 RepID=UPI00193E8681|nr:uncharacterized protein LOC105195266 isoform X2 [Solenopsis invicta]
MSNWHVGDSVYDSQNFILRLSENSVTSSTDNSSLQRFAAKKKTKDEGDVIVISDSSCSPSPEHTKLKWRSKSTSRNVRNKKYRELLESSSSELEKENESDSSYGNRFSKKKFANRTEQIDRSSLISNDLTSDRLFEALLASNNVSTDKTGNNANCNRNQINKSKRFIGESKGHINDRSPVIIDQEINSKVREKYNTEERNKAIKPSCALYDSSNVLSKHPTFNAPKKDSTGKVVLTKKHTHKILQNIKYTQVTYDSPKEKKETNVIIDESTDGEEDIMHPALSFNRKDPSDNSYRPLSEKKKNEIKQWLLTNGSDSQSDSSFNTIPPSNRNSKSGHSSLERFEQTYETPNNRGKINKAWTDEKQETIVSSGNVIRSVLGHSLEQIYETPNNKKQINKVHTDKKQEAIVNSPSVLMHPKTVDQYFKKSKKKSEFCTPDNKSKLLPKAQTDKKATSTVNTLETKVTDCADILDKLYGRAWRDKANAVLPTNEPRKTSGQSINRIVQTKRKPVSKNQYHEDSDVDKNNIKSNQRRNIQQKQREMNDFINDESLSSNDSESMYHSALTNPTIFTSSTKSNQVPDSIKRLQLLCDSDTEDENYKSSSLGNLNRRRLSFSDESSSTSEFDPGDYVPPKYVQNKDVKRSQPSKVTSKFQSMMTKSMEYETFLTSLSNTVPMHRAHPNATKYRLHYKNNKEELCKKLYGLYNEKIFDNELPRDMSIEWNVRMTRTAGYCYNKKSVSSFGVVKSSRIVLATKILDTPDRLRDTLIHEMCHAASWIIDGVSDGHGHFWTRWANKAKKIFPELPPIRRCHNYEIKSKFTYKCTGCGYSIGRHSKSLDIEKKRCGYCYGKFELLINRTTKSGTVHQVETPKREPTGFALYVKQNYNSVKKDKSNMKHAEVMKLLGNGIYV